MNMLRKIINFGYRLGNPNMARQCTRKLAYGTKEPVQHKRIVLEPLNDRELIRVSGPEVVSFLQGLITNDMSHLREGRSMYALFLNKSGRVLYDAVIYKGSDPVTYYIECDKNISYELRRHLRIFRVKRNVQIDEVGDELKPWVLFNANPDDETEIFMPHMGRDYIITTDPRVRNLGIRVIATDDKTRTDFAKALAKPGELTMGSPINGCNYKLHRYSNGVGEGVEDLPPGKSFPLEANADFMHGISFHKGCYVGQELTARVYHTGVIRKRIMPLRLTKSINERDSTVQSVAGAKVGNLRGASANRGLALLRVDQALNNNELMIDGEPCYAEKPQWWPNELPKKTSMRG